MGDCGKMDDRLVLSGEFTIEHAADLKAFLAEAAADGGPGLVDLTQVTRAGISLFQLLVSFATTMEASGFDVRFTGLNEYLTSLAETAGVRDALAPHIAEGG
jgi:ABC-type transporter Mla MlaB component